MEGLEMYCNKCGNYIDETKLYNILKNSVTQVLQ